MTTNPVFTRDPDVHSGAAVFPGTRVPIYILFDYLMGDHRDPEQSARRPCWRRCPSVRRRDVVPPADRPDRVRHCLHGGTDCAEHD
jgi:hypothetical protein